MKNYYIFQNGLIVSAAFDSLEKAREYAKEGGFQGAFIIQLIEKVD